MPCDGLYKAPKVHAENHTMAKLVLWELIKIISFWSIIRLKIERGGIVGSTEIENKVESRQEFVSNAQFLKKEFQNGPQSLTKTHITPQLNLFLFKTLMKPLHIT